MGIVQGVSFRTIKRLSVSLLFLSILICGATAASGQRFSTTDGLTYSVRTYTLPTVQAVGPEGLMGTWPRVVRGDLILAINEVPLLSPEMLSDQHFCSGARSLLILRPWGNQYFETVIRQPGCLFKFGRLAFTPVIRPLVTVEQVFPSSPAARLGLQSGDILYRVGPYSAFGTPQMISARLAYGMARGHFSTFAARGGQMIQLNAPTPGAPVPPIVQTQQATANQESATINAATTAFPPSEPTAQTTELHHSTLLLVNETPFYVSAVVHISIDTEHDRTDGWYTLMPGEKKQLSYAFPSQVTFQVFGETRSPDNVRWVHSGANAEATLYFEGSEDDPSSLHSISRDVPSYTTVSTVPLSHQTPVTESVAFAPATVSETGSSSFVFQDPYVPYLTDTSGLSEDAAMSVIVSRARQLGRAIERQRVFRSRFRSDKDVPYLLGVGTKDKNGRTELGVVVTSVNPTDIFGDPSVFKVGDIITALSGRGGELEPVFSNEDLLSLLYDHATDIDHGGISVPVKFVLIRGSNQVTGITTFHFNLACAQCFPAGELSDFHAFLQGAFDAWTLGNEAWLEVILTDAYKWVTGQPINDITRDHWLLVQRNARLVEYAPVATKWGRNIAFYSFLPSAPRLLVSRLLARTALLEGSTALLTNVVLDTAENATWLVLTASPTHSREDIREDVVTAAPQAAITSLGMNVAIGIWTHHHHYVNLSKGQLK
jgi:hypothetical protein